MGGLAITYGFVVGPSILLVAGLAVAISTSFCDGDDCGSSGGDVPAIAGLGIMAGGTLWQFFRLPGAARKYRTEGRVGSSPKITLAPTWDMQKESLGLLLSFRY